MGVGRNVWYDIRWGGMSVCLFECVSALELLRGESSGEVENKEEWCVSVSECDSVIVCECNGLLVCWFVDV